MCQCIGAIPGPSCPIVCQAPAVQPVDFPSTKCRPKGRQGSNESLFKPALKKKSSSSYLIRNWSTNLEHWNAENPHGFLKYLSHSSGRLPLNEHAMRHRRPSSDFLIHLTPQKVLDVKNLTVEEIWNLYPLLGFSWIFRNLKMVLWVFGV